MGKLGVDVIWAWMIEGLEVAAGMDYRLLLTVFKLCWLYAHPFNGHSLRLAGRVAITHCRVRLFIMFCNDGRLCDGFGG